MTGASLIRGDSIRLPLRDESVDLVVTSPPYFSLRSYQDGGEHYDGQIGSEPTPQAFLEALWAVTAECKRVLKPGGSIFVNLGDKYAGSGGHNNNNNKGISVKSTLTGGMRKLRDETNREQPAATRRSAPDRYNQSAVVRTAHAPGVPAKSLMLLPERFRIGCVDQLGLICRAVVIWDKPNGLPESVTDRVRRSHEDWVHLTKQPRYYAAVDEIREAYLAPEARRTMGNVDPSRGDHGKPNARLDACDTMNPLGKLPGSVWRIASEPLQVPEWVGVDHYAAFPQEWPRRIILGWSPPRVCASCGLPWEHDGTTTTVVRGVRQANHGGSHPGHMASAPSPTTEPVLLQGVLVEDHGQDQGQGAHEDGQGLHRPLPAGPSDGRQARVRDGAPEGDGGCAGPTAPAVGGCPSPERGQGRQPARELGADGEGGPRPAAERSDPAPRVHLPSLPTGRLACRCGCEESRPGVILDPFCGTGTTLMVARALGRHGVGVDLSADYLRLARWRIHDSGHAAKSMNRTWQERQGALL